MGTLLDQIVASKRREIAAAKERSPAAELQARLRDAPAARDFRAAIDRPPQVRVLAEIKKASPSAGVLRADFDPVAIARIYEKHGAAAISVLTDEPFFQGSLDYLRSVRAAVTLPVLRKDFLLDPYQILEARCAGADAVLLIAEILDDATLKLMLDETHRLGMQALVELYDPANLPRVLGSRARLIGVNNRDLQTFSTRLEHTLELATRIPGDCCLVSESGIRAHADLERLGAAGVRAVLVGEALMRASDIGAKLEALQGRGADAS